MSGDITRRTFSARKEVKGVLMQQGRVELDADSDEARVILDYMRRHPAGSDTLEGIAQWWLLEQGLSSAVERIQKALDRLIRDGLVICTRRADGQTCYKLNPRKAAVVLKCLCPQRKRKAKKP